MRALAGLVAMIVAGSARSSTPPADAAEASARAAFQRYDEGWRTYDVEKVAGAFAPEFEWTNEVGLRFDDGTRLRVFLTRLFADPAFRAGRPGPLVIRSVRRVGPDVAIVASSEETDGQKDTATGKIVPALHTNELTVMRRIKGRWLIVDDLTSDESQGI